MKLNRVKITLLHRFNKEDSVVNILCKLTFNQLFGGVRFTDIQSQILFVTITEILFRLTYKRSILYNHKMVYQYNLCDNKVYKSVGIDIFSWIFKGIVSSLSL